MFFVFFFVFVFVFVFVFASSIQDKMLRTALLSSSRFSSRVLSSSSPSLSRPFSSGDLSSYKNLDVVEEEGMAVVSLVGKPVNSLDYPFLCELDDLWKYLFFLFFSFCLSRKAL